MLILGFTWGMIVSAISPANASGELNLGLGLLYNMMWIPFFWGVMGNCGEKSVNSNKKFPCEHPFQRKLCYNSFGDLLLYAVIPVTT